MKKILLIILSCFMLTACSVQKSAETDTASSGNASAGTEALNMDSRDEIGMTPDEIASGFNDKAEDTDFSLGAVTDNGDGTYAIDTGRDDIKVTGDLENGKAVSVEVESAGIFEPGLATYDYMIYAMLACDTTIDFDGADDFIADLYYEANFGGEPVLAGYNGLQYSFQKGDEVYWFKITSDTD